MSFEKIHKRHKYKQLFISFIPYLNDLIYLISNAEIKETNKNEYGMNFNHVTKIPSYNIYFNDRHEYLIQSKQMLVLIFDRNIQLITGKEDYVLNFFYKLSEYKESKYEKKKNY